MSSPKIAIIIYSMYGHIAKMAESVKKGIESAGGSATILQVPETLPKEVLQKMNAPPKPEYPLVTAADLPQYDGFIFGISTRYGNWSGQFKAFWDSTGQIWVSGALAGKFASVFVSSAGPGGGQESTYFSVLTTLVHHGLVFVPLGYKYTSALWNTHFEEVHGGSPFGAGTFAKVDGSRQPSEVELEVASIQGREFYNMLQRYVSKSSAAKGAY
ncbi:putative 1,4-benzoquinone reductase [Serendipita vermifera]|nr:putative 1,4-benzoquinone reductase [Serendipita vermifera]